MVRTGSLLGLGLLLCVGLTPVIDETPWVLWDPENLLTAKVTWTFTVK